MKANRNLNNAKINIDDEFYTRYEDIEKYLSNFKKELKNKIIYLPCDSKKSNFVKFLQSKLKEWNIKELIYSYNDFREKSNKKFWKKADVIITNPPFSLKTPFYEHVKKYECELIVLLPDTLMTNNVYRSDLINKKLFMDNTNKSFIRPDGTIKKAGASWYNTFKKVWNKEWKFNSGNYLITDNGVRYYNRCDNINKTYDKIFYVPITFIKGNNINDYEILGVLNHERIINGETHKKATIDGKYLFTVLVVKKVKND